MLLIFYLVYSRSICLVVVGNSSFNLSSSSVILVLNNSNYGIYSYFSCMRNSKIYLDFTEVVKDNQIILNFSCNPLIIIKNQVLAFDSIFNIFILDLSSF